jgi:hypothetical protein
MNPYLEHESVWQDFHSTFIPLLRELLNPHVAPKYFVKIEEYAFIHELPAEQRRPARRPDLAVSARSPRAGAPGGTTATLAPAYSSIPVPAIDRERHDYLSIRDRDNFEIVTVIELLSPSNKTAGADRSAYLEKRHEFFSSGLNVVEIDLLRGGLRLPFTDVPPCDYLVSISRKEEWPRVALWPVKLRERLPEIPIPLRAPDPDAAIDLQQAIHRVYDSASYGYLVYDRTPQPTLSAEDAAWAQQFIPASAQKPS